VIASAESDCDLIRKDQNRVDEIEDNSGCTLCLKPSKNPPCSGSMASEEGELVDARENVELSGHPLTHLGSRKRNESSKEGVLVDFREDVEQSSKKGMVEKGSKKQEEPVVSGRNEEVREDLDEGELIRHGWKKRNAE
jgi:hypothetical protein